MCGITGIFDTRGRRPVDRALLERMNASQAHRGPDGEGVPRAVCQITAEASPRPVYLKPNKNSAPELWVRTGNSTRQLAVDSATEYVMHRWPLSVGSGLAAQFRAAVRFSEAS